MPLSINTLEEYLKVHCQKPLITVSMVAEYAEKGKAFLEAVMSENEKNYPSHNKTDNVAFLHWYLIKESFDNHQPFSKGMFTLKGSSDEDTQRLYDYLKGEAKTDMSSLGTKIVKGVFTSRSTNEGKAYSRPSTHYNEHLASEEDRSFGIDKGEIPLAWKFKTHTFGLIKNPDDSLSVFFKPETQSMDVNKTTDSFLHGINLIKKTILPEKIKGIKETYREDYLPKNVKAFAKECLKEAGKLTPKIKKMIKKCENIPDLREILNKVEPSIKLDEFLIENYGTENQIGSELQFSILEGGELLAPRINFSRGFFSLSDYRSESNSSTTSSSFTEEEEMEISNLPSRQNSPVDSTTTQGYKERLSSFKDESAKDSLDNSKTQQEFTTPKK